MPPISRGKFKICLATLIRQRYFVQNTLIVLSKYKKTGEFRSPFHKENKKSDSFIHSF